MHRAGHVSTFLKSFRSVLERGPSDKSFRSRSFFVVLFRSVPFRSVLSRKTVFPFRSWRSYLKNGFMPLVLFLVKERFHPHCHLGKEQSFHNYADFTFNEGGIYSEWLFTIDRGRGYLSSWVIVSLHDGVGSSMCLSLDIRSALYLHLTTLITGFTFFQLSKLNYAFILRSVKVMIFSGHVCTYH